jgi:hypothetical protein
MPFQCLRNRKNAGCSRTQLILRISVSLWKTVRKKPKELQVRLNKKIFPPSESSYEKKIFRPLTVKITDEYKTQTDNSDSRSEDKRTKIYEHKTYQSMIENLDVFTTKTEIKDFLWFIENNQPLWMSITNVHCLKDISNSKIYYRLKEVNKNCYKLSLDINMEYYKIIMPDYNFSETINLW